MTEKKKQVLEELTDRLQDDEKPVYLPVVSYLIELGYVPEKRSVRDFSLAFKHKISKRVMARMDFRRNGLKEPSPILSLKFFGAKTIPPKYTDALGQDLAARRGQYSGPLRSETEKNKCGYCQDKCTGGGRGYYYQYPDGREVLRCGAYPIPIPNLTRDDVEEMKQVILEQHEYFLTIE